MKPIPLAQWRILAVLIVVASDLAVAIQFHEITREAGSDATARHHLERGAKDCASGEGCGFEDIDDESDKDEKSGDDLSKTWKSWTKSISDSLDDLRKKTGKWGEDMGKSMKDAQKSADKHLDDAGKQIEEASKGSEKDAKKMGEDAEDAAEDATASIEDGSWNGEPVKKMSRATMPQKREQMYFRPVSPTLYCVMFLSVLSLVIYTALSMSRNYDELSGAFRASALTQTLTAAARSAALPPMMAMLFVACRMYILATTEGLGEPPLWVKICMITATSGMAFQFLLILTLPMVTKLPPGEAEYDMTHGKAGEAQKKSADLSDEDEEEIKDFHETVGEQNDAHPVLNKVRYKDGAGCYRYVFWMGQIGSILAIYGGLGGVVAGILTFPADSMKVSAAVICTIALGLVYFMVYFLLWLGRSLPESHGQTTLLHMALSMSSVSRKVPMYSALFLVSRMRALSLDPPDGLPPFWMQCCFYSIVGVVALECFFAGIVGGIGEVRKAYYGHYLYRSNKVLHLLQHLLSIAGVGLLIAIVVGVGLMEDQDGKVAHLSTTLLCVLAFSAVYFSLVMLQTCAFMLDDVAGIRMPLFQDAAVSAGISIGLAPMMAILFVACRMRALQITNQRGDPQGWAQDCMRIAVFATCLQAFCCLLMPIFVGSAAKVDDDGNPNYDLQPMVGAYAVSMVKYLALMFLHSSVVAICVAVFIMTPKTAHSGNRLLEGSEAMIQALVVTLVIFFIALLLSSAKVIGTAVKIAIESCDKVLLGVDITIDAVAISALRGYVYVRNFKVCQPEEEVIYTRQDNGKLTATHTGVPLEWRRDFIMRVDTVIVKVNLWRAMRTFGKEFEITHVDLSGIHVNFEKPNTNMSETTSNVDYILNHLDTLGLMAKGDRPDAEEKPAKKPAAQAAMPPPPPQKSSEALKSSTAVILHKLVFGDIGCSVTIEEVPVIGALDFNPAIGKFAIEDFNKEVCDDREDLSAGEVVGFIVKKLAKKVLEVVVMDVPRKLAENATAGISVGFQGLKSLGSALASTLKLR
eukprot:TRINITY_DN102409_c0_g1_i1.p1 TRINITY_DN102409_c0_g1~~TRINITY_DN102409_c0_g1_i1.p1  ORF type:complete len:1031 (+),score=216.42 TRINITY_DN102409_c0_g1_i1:63-3155(+)